MAELSLSKARSILRSTLKKARELELKPMSVVIVDAGGHVKAFEREDGASPGRFEIAQGKAFGVIMTGLPGSALQARAEVQAYFVDALNGAYNGKIVPLQGGVLIRDKQGRIVGAVGVTGDTSENDAEIAMAGIEESNMVGEA